MLRGSDLTRLMVTLGVTMVLREIANRYSDLTGGADGLQGVTMAPMLGMFRFDLFGHTAYLYSLVVLFVLFVVARRIVHSPFGLSLRSIKGNALRASAIGIPVDRRLDRVYTVAAFYAGVAGALLTQTTAFGRSTCSRSIARPSCCWCWSSAAWAISTAASSARWCSC